MDAVEAIKQTIALEIKRVESHQQDQVKYGDRYLYDEGIIEGLLMANMMVETVRVLNMPFNELMKNT